MKGLDAQANVSLRYAHMQSNTLSYSDMDKNLKASVRKPETIIRYKK